MRLGPLADRRQLLHQLLVDVQAACRVDDQHVVAGGAGLPQRPLGDLGRAALGALLVHLGAGPLAHGDELLDRRGALGVAGGQSDALPLPRRACLASFAQAVVLPEPCSPAIRITVGPEPAKARSRLAPPISSASSSLTIFTTCWPGIEAVEDPRAQAALSHLRGELLDDLEVDVRLEQGEADLAHRAVDVGLGQLAARANAGERLLQAIGELVEHECVQLTRRGRPTRRAARRRTRGRRTAAGPRAPRRPRSASPGAQLGGDRQRDAALRGPVELGQHDAGQVDRLGERLRLAQAVLARWSRRSRSATRAARPSSRFAATRRTFASSAIRFEWV